MHREGRKTELPRPLRFGGEFLFQKSPHPEKLFFEYSGQQFGGFLSPVLPEQYPSLIPDGEKFLRSILAKNEKSNQSEIKNLIFLVFLSDGGFLPESTFFRLQFGRCGFILSSCRKSA